MVGVAIYDLRNPNIRTKSKFIAALHFYTICSNTPPGKSRNWHQKSQIARLSRSQIYGSSSLIHLHTNCYPAPFRIVLINHSENTNVRATYYYDDLYRSTFGCCDDLLPFLRQSTYLYRLTFQWRKRLSRPTVSSASAWTVLTGVCTKACRVKSKTKWGTVVLTCTTLKVTLLLKLNRALSIPS